MTGNAGFLVEEFINSITTQLDRVQDSLRIKAVNRPLTYALKELHLELKVFVDMDQDGNVRLRASGPNETGASVIHLDFTTITKPMIEENTISMAMARSTPLDELGLAPEEKQRLERVGVTNLAQLNRLGASAGVSTVARYADVPVDKLRQALKAGQPRVTGGGTRSAPRQPASPPPAPPRQTAPTPRPAPLTPRPSAPRRSTPVAGHPLPSRPSRTPPTGSRRRRPDDYLSQGLAGEFGLPEADIQVMDGERSLTLHGENLLAQEVPPEIRLNGAALAIEELDNDRLVVRLPEAAESGTLELSFGDGETLSLGLAVIGADGADGFDYADEPEAEADAYAADPWSPAGDFHGRSEP